MILDERGFETFMEWADRSKELLRKFGNPPSPTSEDEWQTWGESLGLLETMPIIPSPHSYNDWKSWVQALNRTVQV